MRATEKLCETVNIKQKPLIQNATIKRKKIIYEKNKEY